MNGKPAFLSGLCDAIDGIRQVDRQLILPGFCGRALFFETTNDMHLYLFDRLRITEDELYDIFRRVKCSIIISRSIYDKTENGSSAIRLLISSFDIQVPSPYLEFEIKSTFAPDSNGNVIFSPAKLIRANAHP